MSDHETWKKKNAFETLHMLQSINKQNTTRKSVRFNSEGAGCDSQVRGFGRTQDTSAAPFSIPEGHDHDSPTKSCKITDIPCLSSMSVSPRRCWCSVSTLTSHSLSGDVCEFQQFVLFRDQSVSHLHTGSIETVRPP